jgi:hypothetical protein
VADTLAYCDTALMRAIKVLQHRLLSSQIGLSGKFSAQGKKMVPQHFANLPLHLIFHQSFEKDTYYLI